MTISKGFSLENNTIHPLALHIKEKNNLTWKGFAELLTEVLSSNFTSIKVLPSNVRNYSTGANTTWWFWLEISKIVIGYWEEERVKLETSEEKMICDFKYSELFHCDLRQVFGLLHALRRKKDSKKDLCVEIINPAITLANIVISDIEYLFDTAIPTFELLE